ncbi:MAG: ATP-grasp domain-containing protein [Actinobacteria bacterium]|nr:ATP-grasp domain-containing protein [Actinomycetota bacterium]MBI3686948.1 ATP-grasp domain-containing protein [Actinomycetota bacterium]
MRTLVMVMPYRALVEKARAEGFSVHAVWDRRVAEGIFHDQAEDYLAAVEALADGYALTDFTDPTGFESALRRMVDRVDADALYHVGAEESMLTTYRLAERWGIAVNPAAAISHLNDKRAMRRLLADHGVSPVRCAEADDISAVAGLLAGFRLPVVVKPIDLSGSRAVFLLSDPGELPGYARMLDAYGYTGPLLVEEYLRGPEFSVETLSIAGRHQVIGVTRKVLGPAPLFIEAGHLHPVRDDPRTRQIGELAVQLLDMAGYRTGPAHTEVLWTQDGPRIVESQARLGGDRIPRLVQLSTGVDMERGIFQALRGEPVPAPAPDAATTVAGIAYFELPVGRITAISGIDQIRALDLVDEISFPFQVGDRVPRTVDWRTRHGHVIATGDSRASLQRRLERVRELVAAGVRVEPADPTDGRSAALPVDAAAGTGGAR